MNALPLTRGLAVPDHSFFLFQFPKQEELTLVVFPGRCDPAEQDGSQEMDGGKKFRIPKPPKPGSRS
jgi:hypothetical protein